MGARLALMAPSAPTVAISSYVDILDNIQYVELVNNSRFLKTIKAIDLTTGDAIVIKVLIKPSTTASAYSVNLQHVMELMVKEASLLGAAPSCLPWHKFIETDRAGYVIRQMMKTNLYDRISLRPFLQPVEKVFLVFQMLKIVDHLHRKLNIRHGDIKLENFMVSSSNWITLTDFASYTKPVYIPEDNPNQFSFFFDTSDRRVCNLAPERFYNSRTGLTKPQNFDDSGNFNGRNQVTEQMDLFSLGCVIAELFSDGEPLFTLSGLFRYIKNEYAPDLSAIDNKYIREIVSRLIMFDQNDRVSVGTILEDYRGICFPETAYTFVYDFLALLNDNNSFAVPDGNDNITSSDLRINFIYESFDQIVQNLDFNYDQTRYEPRGMVLNLPGMPSDYTLRSASRLKHSAANEDLALVILSYVFSVINTVKRPEGKIKACELIVALSERINDECKLDRSLPYICNFIDEYVVQVSLDKYDENDKRSPRTTTGAAKVVIAALDSITTLLDTCSYLTPLNVLVFPEYLLPKLQKLMTMYANEDEKELIKIKIASCLPSLARIAKKFWMMSKTFKVDAPKSKLPASGENPNPSSNITIPKSTLDTVFEDVSVTLLTDPSPRVRASLVAAIYELCQFFGVDKTNDIILPHLITYLNDPNQELKLTFLEAILSIGPFVGVLSFEQYLLPLLIQTLSDAEQLVVLKVLQIFTTFVKLKIINPVSEFNALNMYKELLGNTIHLILHPNEWIRQSVLELVIAINDNLADADRYCFLYHEIKAYLAYDIVTIDWDNLYPCLTRPLSKVVYATLLLWSESSSEKSLFWHQQAVTPLGPLKLSSFTRDLGKSVFIPSKYKDASSFSSTQSTPLSHEDKQWLLKLRSVGLNDKDIWKVYALRSYVSQVSRGMALHSTRAAKSFLNILGTDIIPRNIFFDVTYKSEPVGSANKVAETNVRQSDLVTPSIKSDRSNSNSLVLPQFGKVSASIQTVEENVFAELETTNDSHHAEFHRNSVAQSAGDKTTRKVIVTNNDKVILADMRHSYSGYNPHILKYLAEVNFELALNLFHEFGETIRTITTNKDWYPTGTPISSINANPSGGEQDSLNCVAVNPSSEFFITGSDSGTIKVWDANKVEKNVMVKKAGLSINLDSSVTDIAFMPQRNVFAVSTVDGCVRLFKVEYARGKNKTIVRFIKLSLIRRAELSKQFATSLLFASDTLLLCTTSSCEIIALNVITMETEFVLHNPPIHGVPVTAVVNKNDNWLLVGTEKGTVCLWDIRFEILLKCWKVIEKDSNETISVSKLVRVDRYGDTKGMSYFAIVSAAREELSIWEVPTFECREIMSPHTATTEIKQFQLVEIGSEADNLEALLEDINLDLSNPQDRDGPTAVAVHSCGSEGYIFQSSADGGLIGWNLKNLERSKGIGRESTFIRNTVHKQLGLTNEKCSVDKASHTSGAGARDKVNCMVVLRKPFDMIVTVDRSGIIRVQI